MKKSNKNQSVIMSAIFMSLGTFGSRILGFVRDMVLASYFSVTLRDAFVVAFRLPNLFRRLLGEGALSVSFIPIYIEQLTPVDGEEPGLAEKRAHDLASGIHSILLGVTSILSTVAIVAMPQLIQLLVGSGFDSVAGKLEATTILARWMFFYLFLVTSYAFYMALLNAHKQFFWPAMAPAIFNLIFIGFAVTPDELWGFSGQQLAVAVLVGGMFQMSMVAISLVRQGLFPRVRVKKMSPSMKKVFRNMVPGLLGMGVLQLMALINVKFASLTGEGSHSYIYFADRILELPNSLIAISLGAALLPSLSESWAKGEKSQMLNLGQKHMRSFLFIALPASVGMYTLCLPIVQVLFERGSFSRADSIATAMVIQSYSVLLLASGLSRVILPNFYAIKNTWYPALASAIGLAAHVLLATFFIEAWGLKGLVYSTIFASFVNLVVLICGYYKFIGRFQILPFVKSLSMSLPGVLALLFGIPFLFVKLQLILQSNNVSLEVSRAMSLASVVSAAIIVYFGLSLLINHPDLEPLKRRFSKK